MYLLSHMIYFYEIIDNRVVYYVHELMVLFLSIS